MITSHKEWEVFYELVRALDDTLKAIGGCDHSVNICQCEYEILREKAREIAQSRKGFDEWGRLLTVKEQVKQNAQSIVCKCGHGKMVHIHMCHVVGCECKRFKSREKSNVSK